MEHESLNFDTAVVQVICRQKEKIERLFDVELLVNQNDTSQIQVTESSTCQVVGKTTNAQKNVGKAKKYIQALIADGQEFSIITENYDLDIVSEILIIKSALEKECCTVITANEGMSAVSIKGHRHDVERCKQFTDNLAQRFRSYQQSVQYEEQFSELIVNNDLEVENQNDFNNGAVVYSEYNLNDTSSEDFEEEIINGIRSDSGYLGKLEFAVKLGYNESDLIEVLKTLDKDAGQNELLSELVKYSDTKPDTGDEAQFVDGNSNIDINIHATQKKADVEEDNGPFRHVIMDGSNVAMSHGNKELFSCRGIQLAVDWFRDRGHTGVTVFVPQWRKETSRSDSRIRDQHILSELEREKILVFTPSRRIGGKRVVCYDDRYILKLAVEMDGIVVSNDNYRDLISENDQFKKVVEERLLMFSFVNDRFMPPDDPLGRNGPTLENFLLKEPAEPEPLPPPCPYGSKKCTYGNKCKYYHPERRTNPHKSVTEKLAEQAKLHMLEMRQRQSPTQPSEGKKKLTRTKTPLSRTRSLNPDEPKQSKQAEETVTSSQDYVMDNYNQKLSESLMKMELDRAMGEQDVLSRGNAQRTPEKKDKGTKSVFGELQESKSSPRLSDLKQKGWGSPREPSPVNLTVPGLSDQRENGQKFLSGHLLLAKKLSDEANESDKMKKKNKAKVDDMLVSTNIKSPLAYPPNVTETGGKKPLNRSKEKQTLSRQLSLQGGEDPRISKGHSSLHTALSYDSHNIHRPSPVSNPAERQMLLQDFMHVQHREMQSDSEQPKNTLHRTSSKDMIRGHTSVSRMQSAPDHFLQTQPSVRPLMRRQNSSSDTQLNKIYHPESEKYHSEIGHPRGPLDNLPMKDTTGNVTFQIGGHMGCRLPQYQLFSPPSQLSSHSLLSPQEYKMQQAAPPDFQPPSHYLHQHPMPRVPHPNLQQVQQSSYPYSPANQQYHGNVDQSNVWNAQSRIHQSVSNFSPQFSGGNIFHHNVSTEANISALNMAGSHGHLQPFPSETPILPNNPRFKLYNDLCNLFPEESVRTVMNQHPEANSAKDLCAYLIKN